MRFAISWATQRAGTDYNQRAALRVVNESGGLRYRLAGHRVVPCRYVLEPSELEMKLG